MSAITDILKQVPIADLAKQLGASQKDTKTASEHAIMSLLGGMTQNVAGGGEESLLSALTKHVASPLLGGDAVDLGQVDTADGAKIVKHALGADPTSAAQAISTKTGTDSSLLTKLLPLLAPIVIAYVAKKYFDSKRQPAGDSGGVLGGLVNSVVGGGSSSEQPKPTKTTKTTKQAPPAQEEQEESSGGVLDSLGGLGGLLGGVLGGGSSKPAQQDSSGGLLGGLGGLGGLLGGMLGGSKAPAAQSGGGLGSLLESLF